MVARTRKLLPPPRRCGGRPRPSWPLAVAESKLEWSNTAANASDDEKGGDQRGHQGFNIPFDERRGERRVAGRGSGTVNPAQAGPRSLGRHRRRRCDRKSVVAGKRVSVRVELGGSGSL